METIINETTYNNMQKNNKKLLVHIEKCENEIRKLQEENQKQKKGIVFIRAEYALLEENYHNLFNNGINCKNEVIKVFEGYGITEENKGL